MKTYPSSPHPYPVPCAFGEYPVSVKNVLNYFSSPLQSKATFISEFYISILASAFMSTDTYSSTEPNTKNTKKENYKDHKNQENGKGGEECHVAALVGVMKQLPEKERSREWPGVGL